LLGKVGGSEGLNSAAEVKLARLDEPVVWLGADQGLFAYTCDRRRMFLLTSGHCVGLEPLRSPSPRAMRRALAATGKGLLMCGERPQGIVEYQILDKDPIIAFGLDEEQQFATYCIRKAEPGLVASNETRCISAPFFPGSSMVIVPAEGWTNAPKETPTVRGLRSIGPLQLFVTSGGAFLYDSMRRSYQDCSNAQYDWAEQNATNRVVDKMKEVACLSGGSIGKVAVRNDVKGKAAPFELTKVNDQWIWVALALPGASEPTALTYCADKCIGLGPMGQLYAYDAAYNFPPLFSTVAPRTALPTRLNLPTCLATCSSLETTVPGSHSSTMVGWRCMTSPVETCPNGNFLPH